MSRDSIVSAQAYVGITTEDRSAGGATAAQAAPAPAQNDDDDANIAEKLFQMARDALTNANTETHSASRQRWIASYQAFNNRHFAGSKYTHQRFRGRSRFFRPKTRSAVRASMMTAANALFATADVVSITAGDDQNPQQRASAAIKQELVNYRLDRANAHAAIPWFITAMGAVQTSTITGLCASKQFWEYEEREVEEETEIDEIVTADDGTAFTRRGKRTTTRKLVHRDRPMIKLYPMEQVGRDPAADWTNQANGAYLWLSEPITVHDLRQFMDRPGPTVWRELDESVLAKAVDEYQSTGVRVAREGNDRLDDKGRPVGEHDLTWIYEWFIRYDGQDWNFWSLGQQQLLSEPIPMHKAYPWNNGDRPVVIGTSVIDAFTINPLSPVESWQPIQQEINDVVNLRLDNLKQVMSPLTKVRRGRRVSIEAIQNRSPDTVLLLDQLDDVEFDRPPSFDSAAYAEMERLNNDFDDLAGKFSAGSVQSNRQLNETVGGMRMLNSAASSMSEFDLRTWIETWVEPVLRQVVKLEEFYETDETILGLAASKAKLMQRFGVDDVTDDLLNRDVAVRVNVGIGAGDPMQALAKFNAAIQGFIALGGERAAMKLNLDEIADEILGKAGYRDADRFVLKDEEGQQDPRLQQLMQENQQLKQAIEQKQAEQQAKMQIEQMKQQGQAAKMQADQQARQLELAFEAKKTDLDVAIEKQKLEIERQKLELEAARFRVDGERHDQETRMRMAETDVGVDEDGQEVAGSVLLAKALADLKAQQAKPKQIIYDDAGRIIGIAPTSDGETMQ